MKCEICEIIKNNTNIELTILKSPRWVVELDPNQQNLGKCWITLKAHKNMLSDLDATDWSEFIEIIQKLESNCMLAFSPHHFNWQCLMNDSSISNQEPHVHWHFSPRYDKPINFHGDTFIDENYPKTNKNPRLTDQNTLNKIAEEIKK